jgi:hypothetical protein
LSPTGASRGSDLNASLNNYRMQNIKQYIVVILEIPHKVGLLRINLFSYIPYVQSFKIVSLFKCAVYFTLFWNHFDFHIFQWLIL